MTFWSASVLIMATIGCSSLVIYPFLHESGHYLAAMLMGCRIVGFEYISGFKMTISVKGGAAEAMFIAFFGLVLPFVCGMLMPARCFVLWCVKVVLSAMTVIVTLLSTICMFMHLCGTSVSDDMVAVAQMFPQTRYINFIFLVIIGFIAVIYIKKQRVILRVSNYLNHA